MIREMRKKMVILHNRRPFKDSVRAHLQDLELREWVYMNLRFSGSSLSRENIDTILNGGWILEATVEEHLMIERLVQLLRYILRQTDMGANLNLRILGEIHSIITEGQPEIQEEYRKGSPVLLEYGTTPMLPADIPAAMKQVADYAAADAEGEGEVFLKAARIHNRILEIWPYREGNEILARAAMYWCLARKGYPLAALNMTEQDYNRQVSTYLKGGSSRDLAEALVGAVHSRLELMIQLTAYEN